MLLQHLLTFTSRVPRSVGKRASGLTPEVIQGLVVAKSIPIGTPPNPFLRDHVEHPLDGRHVEPLPALVRCARSIVCRARRHSNFESEEHS